MLYDRDPPEEPTKTKNRFGDLLEMMTTNRWYITLINLSTFAMIVLGILAAIIFQTPVASEWKELLLLMLGAFIGNYTKTAEFWFSNEDRDKLLVQKMDEEDDAPGTPKAEVDLKTSSKTAKAAKKVKDGSI